MKCPKCQHQIPEDSKFCKECGQELKLLSEPPPQTIFIDEKIDKIQRYLPKGLTEKILAQRGKIEGERKQVTVMFCDMVGFTPMVEKLGTEKAYSVMDDVYEILIHKVHEYEGTVNEMTGDGIMALFGAPIALEDAPQRALRSALAVHGEIARFNGQREGITPIKMRIGLHTGPVVVGTLGNDLRVEFKAVGDTVNLASRMEGLAEAGTTYVTEEIFKLTEALFRFESLGDKAVKGKESLIPVYKLLSAKKDVHRPRLGIERSIYSEMVGRDKELNDLEFQIMKAIRGEGSIVNVIGEAGIGKSRLLAELKNRDVIKQVTLFEGRAISTGRNLSFYPVIDLLKQWARIGEDDSGAAALNKLETSIRRVIPENLHEILPFVATLMGIKLTGRYAERIRGIEGEALEKLILKNMRDLLIKATELKPHVIVMEDLHWSDTSSIELITALMRLVETQRIVFINVFRPGYKETSDRIIEAIHEKSPDYYAEINLQPLDSRMSETLINNMLHIKGLKHDVINQIVERADGNPFFIEEVVRSFIDHGAIVQKDGVFEVTQKIDRMVIPHTINDVLMARIDRLEEKTRDLVKVASVIGRSFFYRILSEVAKTIDDIDNSLSYLQEIQLIREQKRMEELEYLFKHALAQEAAYESILHQKRKELHVRVANSIEKVFKERLHEFYGMLAYHYSKGDDLDKAEEYMIKAGEEALGSSASSEALRYYQGALDLYLNKYGETADPEKLAMLEKNIALAFYNKGELADAVIYFDRVLKRWGIKGPRNKYLMLIKLLADLLKVILHLYFPIMKSTKVPGDKENEIFSLCVKNAESLIMINPMRTLAENMWTIQKMLGFDLRKIKDWSATFLSGAATLAATGLSFRLSKKILDHGKDLIDKNNYREMFDFDYFTLTSNYFSGDWKNIQNYDEFLADQNLKVGRFFNISAYISLHGIVKLNQGEFSAVYPVIKRLSEIADSYEYEIAKVWQLQLETSLFYKRRELYGAQKKLQQFELYTAKSGRDMERLTCLGLKALIQFRSEDLDGTEKSLTQAAEIVEKQAIISPSPASHYLLAKFIYNIRVLEILIHSSNKSNIAKHKKDAFKSGKNALKIAKKSAAHVSEIFRSMGLYYWLIGKQQMAVKWWKRGIEESVRLGARPELARTYMEIGKRFLEEKSNYKELNGISAEEYLEKARKMFEEMDLQWDLDELDKITIAH